MNSSFVWIFINFICLSFCCFENSNDCGKSIEIVDEGYGRCFALKFQDFKSLRSELQFYKLLAFNLHVNISECR